MVQDYLYEPSFPSPVAVNTMYDKNPFESEKQSSIVPNSLLDKFNSVDNLDHHEQETRLAINTKRHYDTSPVMKMTNSLNVEDELDSAIRSALEESDGDSLSDITNINSNSFDTSSIASGMNSVKSSKSAVQVRLEKRKKQSGLEMSILQSKLEAAGKRRSQFLDQVSNKASGEVEKISSARSIVSTSKEAELMAIKELHEQKLSLASERKENLLRSKSSRARKSSDDISITKEAEVMTLKKTHEEKIINAVERKENILRNKTAHIRGKLDKITVLKNSTGEKEKAELLEIQNKHDAKLANAAQRKEDFLQNKASQLKTRMTKVLSTRNLIEDQKEAEVMALKKKHEEKLSNASERKNLFLNNISRKVGTKLERVTITRKVIEGIKDAELKSIQKKSDEKLYTATERKEALIEKKTNQLSSYLSSAYQRGQNALRIKMQNPTNTEVYGKVNHDGFQDEISVSGSVLTTGSTKSKVQIRLENYKKSKPSKSSMDERLEAAKKRRDSVILQTREKAGFQSKMKKVTEKLVSTELSIKQLSVKLTQKMQSATQRKQEHLNGSNLERALQERKKLENANKAKAEKNAKLSAIQEKLETKLVAALERKDKIMSEKSAKAGGSVSVSAERGQAALMRKEATVLQLKNKSRSKIDSAKKRRLRLRHLEKQKKEVMMLRREMARSMDAENKLVEETDKLKNKVNHKHEAAASRRARLAEEASKRREMRNQKRLKAIELATQRKTEAMDIAAWESSSQHEQESLAPVQEEDFGDDEYDEKSETNIPEENPSLEDQLDERRLMAKQQLVDEIRLANEAKYNELDRIRKEMKSVKRPDSAMSFGTIESTEMMSFDEVDMSISGLSTVREEENNNDRRQAQAALALAELDIKLSEIQILQAMLLAEEASQSGASEFKTSQKSITELDSVEITKVVNGNKKQESSDSRFRNRAKNFFNLSMKKAKDVQTRAGKAIQELKKNVVEHEVNRNAGKRF